MFDENPDYLIWHASSVPARNYRTRYIRRFMRQRPVMSREALLAVASWRQSRRGERNYIDDSFLSAKTRERRPLTDEEVRFHVALSDRLVAIDRECHGFWQRLRRFLFRR